MINCSICGKENKGFKCFVKYNLVTILQEGKEHIPLIANRKVQILICDKCLKKKLPTINLD